MYNNAIIPFFPLLNHVGVLMLLHVLVKMVKTKNINSSFATKNIIKEMINRLNDQSMTNTNGGDNNNIEQVIENIFAWHY
jgi:hypothetical protein